ncbi:MAG: serine protein kinase RIO [Nitrososphaerales archaeon]
MVKHLRERDEPGEFSSQKVHQKAEQIDKRDRVILKNEEEREVFEEVFDRQSLMILYDLSNKGEFSYLNGVISSGKEARVYAGITSEGKDIAVKIYLVASSDYKKRMQYVIGDPRFTKIRKGSRGVAELWARKEYTNLKAAFNAGAPVPDPLAFSGNVVIMQFIGLSGVPAPRLVETDVTRNDYLQSIKALKQVYQKALLVHADLSEYNIMKLERKIILFDFSSAVSIVHPMAQEYLRRDVSNLNRFFTRRGVATIEDETLLERLNTGMKLPESEPKEEQKVGLQ